MHFHDNRSQLLSVRLFQNLGPAALADLFSELDWLSLTGGETLFRTGDAGDALYVVLSGRLRILLEHSDGTSEIIREVARGETVGELALLTGKPRSATVLAIRDTDLARLSRAAFENALRKHPQIVSQLAIQIADRQSQATDETLSRRNIRTLAILPFDEQVPAADFARSVAAALRAAGSTLHLDKRSMDVNGGSASNQAAGNAALTSYLNSLRTDHHFVVYEAEADLSSWTDQCIRQADLILIVAAVNSAPSNTRLHALNAFLSRPNINTVLELLLLSY